MFTAYFRKQFLMKALQCGCLKINLCNNFCVPLCSYVLIPKQDLMDQHQEFQEKLQDICDLLTQTENQIIGHKEALVIEDSKTELQQYQVRQQVNY